MAHSSPSETGSDIHVPIIKIRVYREHFRLLIKIQAQMSSVGMTNRHATLGGDLVISHKPSMIGSGQPLDGEPQGETQVFQ